MVVSATIPWWKRFVRWLFFSAVVVITLLILAASIISYHGRREWDRTKRDLLARGEKLSGPELAPPPVPDEQNFFADPLWAEIVEKPGRTGADEIGRETLVPLDQQQLRFFNKHLPQSEIDALKKSYPRFATLDFQEARGGLLPRPWLHLDTRDQAYRDDLARFTLAGLAPVDPILDRICALLQRPAARFPVNYELAFTASLPHISTLMSLGQAFLLRARAEVQLRQGQDAARDICTLIALTGVIRMEPLVISQLVRDSLFSMSVIPLKAGIDQHLWTDGQLAGFDQMLRPENLGRDLALGLRGHRGQFNMLMEGLRSDRVDAYADLVMAEGLSDSDDTVSWRQWRDESQWQRGLATLVIKAYLGIFGTADQAYLNRKLQSLIDSAERATQTGLTPALGELPVEYSARGFRATHVLSVLFSPALFSVVAKTAQTQDLIIQARLACALERYYLAYKEYPERLDQLVPAYLPVIPADIVTLQPMHYERTAPGAFKLWSIGWDGKDNHGRPIQFHHRDDGDWVWGEPAF